MEGQRGSSDKGSPTRNKDSHSSRSSPSAGGGSARPTSDSGAGDDPQKRRFADDAATTSRSAQARTKADGEAPPERRRRAKSEGGPSLLAKLGLPSPRLFKPRRFGRQREGGLLAVPSHGPVLMHRSSGAIQPLEGIHLRIDGLASRESARGPGGGPDLDSSDAEILPGQMATALDGPALEQLAFTIFCACRRWRGSGKTEKALLQRVADGLQVDREVVRSTGGMLEQARIDAAGEDSPVGTLKLPLAMLVVGRASHFGKWSSFLSWRSCWEQILQHVAVEQAKGLKLRGVEGGSRMLARLAGSLRRMQVRDRDEYDAEEYAEAVGLMRETVERVVETVGSEEAGHTAAGAGGGITEEAPGSDRLYPEVFDPRAGGAGWDLPLQIRTSVARCLLSCVFDPLEEDDVIPEKEELQEALRVSVWPALGITSEMDAGLHAWVWFSQYLSGGSPAVLSGCLSACEGAASRAADSSAGAGDEDAETLLCPSVVAAIQEAVGSHLSDMHRRFRADLAMPDKLYGLLRVLETATPDRERLHELVRGTVSSSIRAEFLRASDSRGGDSARALLALAKDTAHIRQVALDCYAEAAGTVMPGVREAIARELHSCYGEAIISFLKSAEKYLSKELLELVAFADRLDAALLRCAVGEEFVLAPVFKDACADEHPESWRVMGAMQPALREWITSNVNNLPTWVRRINAEEGWRSPKGQRLQMSGSAREVLKIIHDTLEYLLGLGLRIPADLLRNVTDVLCSVVIEFSNHAAKDLDSSRFVPPVPILTRYKQKTVEKSMKSEARKRGGVGEAAMQHPSAPPADADGADGHRSPGAGGSEPPTDADSIALRINSLAQIRDKLPACVNDLADSWVPLGSVPGGAPTAEEFTCGLFDAAIHHVDVVIEDVLEFMVAKIIYHDLRHEIFGELYHWNVREAPLGPVLAKLDGALGDVASQVDDFDLRDMCALHTLRGMVRALLRVLLDGGDARFFGPQDAEFIEKDIDADLRGLFLSDGDGLDDETVEKELKPVREVLLLMKRDSSQLMLDFEKLEVKPEYYPGEPQMPPYPSQKLAGDPQVLLRVLCHRADRNCSKLLKKHYQLPRSEASNEVLKAKAKRFSALFKGDVSKSQKSVKDDTSNSCSGFWTSMRKSKTLISGPETGST